MAADFRVVLDPAGLDELLNTPEGPVGIVVEELADKATGYARTLAPVLKRKYQPLHMYGPSGETKTSVHKTGFRFNQLGQMYNGVNVNFGPTVFLQQPARQYNGARTWMFMSQALDAVTL